MLSVTSGYKTANKSNVVRSNGKISVYDTVALTTKEFDNTKVGLIEITGTTFRDGTIIGNLSMHDIKIEMYGDTSADFSLNSEKHITPSFAMLVGGSYEWLAYQKFIVSSVEYDDTTRMTTIRGADFLWKSNVDFVDTNTYPMTLYNYLLSVGTACGLSIENVSIINGSFSIESKPFPDFTPCSYIFSRIAELGGYFVRIKKSNNKLEFINAFPSIASPSETMTKDNYFQMWVKEHNFGTNGINTLVMKISQVEGENNAVENAPNVAIDGAIEVQVVDNDIVNTETKRLAVIDNLFTVVDGFDFVPCIVDYIGYPYLEVGDTVQVTKMDNSTFVTVITDIMISYDGGMKGQIRGQTLNKTQTTYRNFSREEKRIRNTEIQVDKVNDRITLEVGTAIGGQDSILPYTQSDWESGGIGATGLSEVNTSYIRTIDYQPILSSTDYVLQCSSLLDFANTIIFFYTSANTFISYLSFTGGERKITTPATATKFRIRARKADASTFLLNEMPNHYVRVVPVGKYLKGARYEFTDTNFAIKNNANETVLTADINGNLEMIGKVTATSGKIGRFDISGDDLVYTSDLFDKTYDYGDISKLSRILAGLDTPTAYESEVYDVNRDGLIDILDLVQVSNHVKSGTALPTPRRQIRSVIRIGTTSGELRTTSVSALGNTGSTFVMKAENLSGELLNVKGISAKGGTIELLDVINGVRFPATFVGSSDVNTLDDYEEGTWTPTVVGTTTAGTGTYNTQVGGYTKIGRVVHFNIQIIWTAHTGTGNLEVTLPFSGGATWSPVSIVPSSLTYSNTLGGMTVPNVARIRFYTYASNTAFSVGLPMDTSGALYISGTYMV